MRDRVEIECERVRFAESVILAHFQVAIAGMSVVPLEMRNDLEPVVSRLEEPGNFLAEIALDKIEHAPHAGENVCGKELASVDRQMIEMAVRSGLGRRKRSPRKRR